VPIDAERDRARAVPEVHICVIEIHSVRTRSSVAASARAAMRPTPAAFRDSRAVNWRMLHATPNCGCCRKGFSA
jgi:hypothetical protein